MVYAQQSNESLSSSTIVGIATFISVYRVAQKSKPPPIFQKIVLKIANEITFLRKVKVWIKYYNTFRW